MTVEFIKKSINETQRAEENNKVKTIVENTLKEIELKGDLKKCFKMQKTHEKKNQVLKKVERKQKN